MDEPRKMRIFDVLVSAQGECCITLRGTTDAARRPFATGGAMAYWVADFAGNPADAEFALHVGAGASEGIVDDLLLGLVDAGYRVPRARRTSLSHH